MSTATTRLRRAGAGGLAAAVIAGTLVASAGSALAWNTGTAQGSAAVASTPVILTGAAAGLGGKVTLTLPTTWNVGDTINFSIAGANCTVTANTIKFAAAPALVAAKGASAPVADVVPTFSSAATQNGAGCSAAAANTGYTLTFTNNATNTVAPTLTIGNGTTSPTFNVGTGAPVGNLNLTFATTGVGTQPAFNGTSVTDAVISAGSVIVSSGSRAVVHPTIAGQAIPTVTVKEVVPATLGTSVTIGFGTAVVDGTNFGTSGTAKATWTGGGTLTLAASGTHAVLISGLTPTTTTAGTLTLSGVTITPAALVAGAGAAISATATGTGITGTAAAVVAANAVTQNTGGSDRYFTAKVLYDLQVGAATNTTNVVLASGANYPDALSANTLAKALGGGVLLTDPTSLSQAASLAIISHKINNVYIVGGTGAVSAAVAAQVAALAINDGTQANPVVVRLGGADRYVTNNMVNVYAKSINAAMSTTAVVATGQSFADALAVGPEVTNQYMPLILTPTAALGTSAAASLVDLGITKVVIVGGTGAVSTAVENSITSKGITVQFRLAGADRTQTAQQIATWATQGLAATTAYPLGLASLTFSRTLVHIANGANFPDALAAGSYAGGNAQVILLSNSPTAAGVGGPAFVQGLANLTAPALVGTFNGLGLSGAVSNSVLNAFALGILG